jgi:transposase
MPKRKRYSAEFKHEAIEMANTGEVSISQVARELGIEPNILSRWCRESANAGAKAFQGHGKPRDEELALLKRELSRVKKERDFLQEAAAFFAKASK